MSRKAPGEHQEVDFEVAPFDCQRSLRPSDRAPEILSLAETLEAATPACPPKAGVGGGGFRPNSGKHCWLTPAVGTLRGVVKRFLLPLSNYQLIVPINTAQPSLAS